MKAKTVKSIVSSALALMLLGSSVGCGGGGGGGASSSTAGGNGGAIPVKMLITGFVNLPTDANDPYKKWIKDNYNLDVTLKASGDLSGTAVTEFASNDKPDIVAFDSMDTYNMVKEQKVLLDDWTPYLSQMPNAQKIVNMKDADKPNSDSVAKQMLTSDGKLGAIWTVPDAPTWSLKIREDWAEEYRSTTVGGEINGYTYPAGNVATNGDEWQPLTPTDLIHFARWIKATKPGCYAFTSAGSKNSLGTLGNWLPLMWGTVAELPYGAYVKDNNEVGFPVVDGTHKHYIEYLKQIVSEGLIDPAWYEQTWENKTKTKQGFIGIEWYPGSISTETQSYHENVDTTNWWKTYNLPCAPGFDAGYMPLEGYVGKIICVSKRAALNAAKMSAICDFLDDCLVYYDEATSSYVRPVGYDALRWGVGVESGYVFQDITGSSYKYINTKETDSNTYYRNTTVGAGAWDWGAWCATSKDGIVQGGTATVDALTIKVVEHNATTAAMKTKVQVGSALNLDSGLVKHLNSEQIHWEYAFVTSAAGTISYDQFLAKWRNDWGGNTLLAEARQQFIDLGILIG